MSNYRNLGVKEALEKFAISWQSPAMNQIFEGALDKAYERGVQHHIASTLPYYDMLNAQNALKRPNADLSQKSMRKIKARPEALALKNFFNKGFTTAKQRAQKDPLFLSQNQDALPLRAMPSTLRQSIFGGYPKKNGYTWRSIPAPADSYGLNIDILGLHNPSQIEARGWVPNVEDHLNNPNTRRRIEQQAPGGVQRLREYIARAQGRGPTPAFSVKNLK